jgi:hypothetical protein
MEEEICLVDSCTTNTTPREVKFFQTLTKRQGQVLTIAGRDATIVGSGRATIVLPMGTQIHIEEALLYPDSTRTLLSYRDIRKNGIHVETHEEYNEFLLLTKDIGYCKQTLEKVSSLPFGLYYTYIKLVPHVTVNFQNVDAFKTWHERLRHPDIGMMRKIMSNSSGHGMSDRKFPESSYFLCTSRATGKLILRPSHLKIQAKPLKFLERIQGGICDPIQTLSGPFRYFMV